jgi:hypothetical protein
MNETITVTKTCSKCGNEKNTNEFYSKRGECKPCKRKLMNNTRVTFKHPTVCYFMELDGFIKIGFTEDMLQKKCRLRYNTQNHPTLKHVTSYTKQLEVLATVEGGRESEKVLHMRFADDKVQGEWFLRSEDLNNFINNLKLSQCKN